MRKEEIVNVLQSMAREWFGSSQQNIIHAEILRDKGLNKLADKFQEEGNEEFEEAQKVIKRIIELGGNLTVSISDFPIIYDVKELIEYMYNTTENGIKELSNIASQLNDDFITLNLINEFILGEKEHNDWLRKDIKLIELIGIENYILEQL